MINFDKGSVGNWPPTDIKINTPQATGILLMRLQHVRKAYDVLQYTLKEINGLGTDDQWRVIRYAEASQDMGQALCWMQEAVISCEADRTISRQTDVYESWHNERNWVYRTLAGGGFRPYVKDGQILLNMDQKTLDQIEAWVRR